MKKVIADELLPANFPFGELACVYIIHKEFVTPEKQFLMIFGMLYIVGRWVWSTLKQNQVDPKDL